MGRETKLLFPTVETQQYFQVSGKFHTIFCSITLFKALYFPSSAAVALFLKVFAWGVRGWEPAKTHVDSAQLVYTPAPPLLAVVALERLRNWKAQKQIYGLGYYYYY